MIFTKICDAVKTYHLWSASSLQWWWSSSSSKEVEMTSLSISKRQQSFNVNPRWVNVREHRDSIVGCMRWEVRTLMSVAAVYCRWVNVRVHPLRLVVVLCRLRRLEKAPDFRLPLLRDPVRVRVGNWKSAAATSYSAGSAGRTTHLFRLVHNLAWRGFETLSCEGM